VEGLGGLLGGSWREYMLPAASVPLPAFPLPPTGKIDRKALPAPEADRPDTGRRSVAPRTPTERELARVWAEALGVERVGAEDNFFDLGGSSLSAVQFTFRVRELFQVALPLRTLFEARPGAACALRMEDRVLGQYDWEARVELGAGET